MTGAIRVDSSLPRTTATLRRLGGKAITDRMKQRLQSASKDLVPDVQAEGKKVLPRRYAAILNPSLVARARASSGGGYVRLSIVVHADGKREKRDLPRLNKGRLRHPIPAGRKHPWVEQAVRPGMVDRPIEEMKKRVDSEMTELADEIGESL